MTVTVLRISERYKEWPLECVVAHERSLSVCMTFKIHATIADMCTSVVSGVFPIRLIGRKGVPASARKFNIIARACKTDSHLSAIYGYSSPKIYMYVQSFILINLELNR
jgi:hypothetical protein